MTRTRSLFAVSFGVALAAACGGSTSNSGNSDGGGSGNSSGGSGSSGAGASSSSGAGAEVDGGIPCGQNSCVSPQKCCYTQGDAGGAFPAQVASCADSCPDGGTQISCTSSAQCQGSDVCCSSFGGGALSVTCAAQCSGGSFQLCASDAECLNGGSCVGGLMGVPKVCMPDGGFTFPDGGGYMVPDGGFVRRDAGGTTGDAGSSADGPSE